MRTEKDSYSTDDLVTYASAKLTTSDKVAFWDSYNEPEIPYGLVTSGVISDYNTGQMADGDVSAPPRMPELPAALVAGLDFADMPESNWSFQPLLNQTDANGWSVTCYIVPPEGERCPHAVPRHYHNEDQVFIVLDGEVRQGSRRFGPGSGIFMPAGSAYGVQYGPQGARYLEIRHGSPETRGISYVEDDPGRFRQIMYPDAVSTAGG